MATFQPSVASVLQDLYFQDLIPLIEMFELEKTFSIPEAGETPADLHSQEAFEFFVGIVIGAVAARGPEKAVEEAERRVELLKHHKDTNQKLREIPEFDEFKTDITLLGVISKINPNLLVDQPVKVIYPIYAIMAVFVKLITEIPATAQ